MLVYLILDYVNIIGILSLITLGIYGLVASICNLTYDPNKEKILDTKKKNKKIFFFFIIDKTKPR